MDTADRNYVEALIERAATATRTARDVADLHGLVYTVEKLTFALEIMERALPPLAEWERNPDGTTGPEHVTDEGIELGPPKG